VGRPICKRGIGIECLARNFWKNYDVIAMWDVLEHLPDPMLILEQIKSHLDSEGIFCFSTLDIDNWFPKLTGTN